MESIVSNFGPFKVPKSVENGPICGQIPVKNGAHFSFFKMDLGLSYQWVGPHFTTILPILTLLCTKLYTSHLC